MTTIKKEAKKRRSNICNNQRSKQEFNRYKSGFESSGGRPLCRSYCLAPSALVYAWPWFLVWHPKMDEYMESLDATLDEVSERLITLGGAPYASMVEFLEHSNIQEEKGSFERSMEENLGRVLSIFRYLVSLYQKALDITDAEGDDVTNDIFVGAKAELEKHIWMIAAELGQAPGL